MVVESTVKVCGLSYKSPASFTSALKALSFLSLGSKLSKLRVKYSITDPALCSGKIMCWVTVWKIKSGLAGRKLGAKKRP
jgi:hypothetical protein